MIQPTQTTAPQTPACHFPGRPGPAGHINACQLCPQSPTYWRDPADATTTKPCTSMTTTPAEVTA